MEPIVLDTHAGKLFIERTNNQEPTYILFTLESLGGKGAAFTKKELVQIFKAILTLGDN